MAENSLNGDVAAVTWTAAAGASTREAGQEGEARGQKLRRRFAAPPPEVPRSGDQPMSDEPAHELDSFA